MPPPCPTVISAWRARSASSLRSCQETSGRGLWLHADKVAVHQRDRGALRPTRAHGIEAHVIHPTSIAVSREHRRAKTDRLDTALLKRVFLGWLRGEPEHCHMAAIPTLEQRRAQVQGELAKLTGAMAARNRQLAEVGGQFQSALQEMANTQSQLADVRRQLAGPLIPVQQPQQVGSGEQGATQPSAEPQPE